MNFISYLFFIYVLYIVTNKVLAVTNIVLYYHIHTDNYKYHGTTVPKPSINIRHFLVNSRSPVDYRNLRSWQSLLQLYSKSYVGLVGDTFETKVVASNCGREPKDFSKNVCAPWGNLWVSQLLPYWACLSCR